MKTTGHLLALLAIAAGTSAHAQFNISDVQYWVGTGADSSVLVIDFQDGTADPSYAWGWLHNGGTGEDMVNAIAAADPDLNVEITGGFLNSITYGSHAGIGGAPDYWSTWDGPSLDDMVSNLGLATAVGNGHWFGCSYTDFDPALPPTEPIAASIPTGILQTDMRTIQVYPQPATDLLYLANAAPGKQAVAIHDLTGARVYQGHTSGGGTSIDVRALAPGLYVLHTAQVKRTIIIQ